MRVFPGGDLLGLQGYENNAKEDSDAIAQSCYGDRKAWFSFSVSRLSVGCLQLLLVDIGPSLMPSWKAENV